MALIYKFSLSLPKAIDIVVVDRTHFARYNMYIRIAK